MSENPTDWNCHQLGQIRGNLSTVQSMNGSDNGWDIGKQNKQLPSLFQVTALSFIVQFLLKSKLEFKALKIKNTCMYCVSSEELYTLQIPQ